MTLFGLVIHHDDDVLVLAAPADLDLDHRVARDASVFSDVPGCE